MSLVTPPGAEHLEIVPLTGTIGAELRGLDVAAGLTDAEVAAVRAALVAYRVVFLPGQHVTPTEQIAFGRRFGALTPAHPLVGGLDDGHPEVLVLDSSDYPLGVGRKGEGTSYNDRWHTDVTFSERPPLASILSAKQVPRRGGDTVWADLIRAYGTLSPPVQRLLDDLVAVHDASSTFDRFRSDDPDGANRTRLAALAPVRHPVVRVHPETGERGLFVNPTFTVAIEGLLQHESTALLEMLYHHMTLPEHVVRWRWSNGDLVMWDNRSTAHYAAADYTERRVMHRVTVAGDPPYGVGAASSA